MWPITVDQFVIANALFFGLILAYLFVRSDGKRPVQLNMKNGDPAPMRARVLSGAPSSPVPRDAREPESRSLNVLFNWNGHTWDAYEVLGCPAGASIELAKAAFESARRQADSQSIEFLEAAFEAIRSSQAASRHMGRG